MAGDNSSSHAEGWSADSGHGDLAPPAVRRRRASSPVPALASDAGRGFGPSPDTAGPGPGLPLIAALADSLEIERNGGAGSRLTMSFPRARPAPAMGPA